MYTSNNFEFTVITKGGYGSFWVHNGKYRNCNITSVDNINREVEKIFFCFVGGTITFPESTYYIICNSNHDKPNSTTQAYITGLGSDKTTYNDTNITKAELINLSEPIDKENADGTYSFTQGANSSYKDYKIKLFECNVPYEFRWYVTYNDFLNDKDNLFNNNPKGGTQIYVDDDGTITDSPTTKLTSSFKSQVGFALNGINKRGGAFQYSCKMTNASNWFPLLLYIKDTGNIITGIIKNSLVSDVSGIITKKYLKQRTKVFNDDTSYNNWVDEYFNSIPSGDYDTDVYELVTESIDLATATFNTRYLNINHTDSIEVADDDLIIYGINNSYYLSMIKHEIMSNQIPFKKYYFENFNDYNDWKNGKDKYPIPFEDIDESGNPTDNDTPITPTIPTSDVPDLNIFTIPTTSWNSFYVLDLADLTVLSQFLWNSDESIYNSIVKGLALCGNKPLDAIISLRLYPFNILSYCESVDNNLQIGRVTVDTIQTTKRLTKITPHIHIGSKFIGRYYGDYKDYSPYTSLTLYLPYYGNLEIDTNSVMEKTLNIDMVFDIYTGTATYILSVNGNIIKLVDCNIGFDIPITSTDYSTVTSSIFNGIMQTSIGIGSVASGNLIGLGAVTSGINNLVSAQASGGYQTSARPKSLISLMLCQYPYIIRTYTPYSEPNNYNIQHGYPYNKTNTISALKGYMEIENANLNVSNATDNEIMEIRNLLRNGVIYK